LGLALKIGLSAAVVVILFVTILAMLVGVVDWYVPQPCKLNTDFCLDLRALAGGRAALVAGLGSAALSFISTIAIVATIFFAAESAKSSNEAAGAAQKALDLNQRTAEIELRPYVAFGHIELPIIIRGPEQGGRCIQVNWHNTGVSQARNVRMQASHLVTDHAGLPADFNFPDRGGPEWAGFMGGKSFPIYCPTAGITGEQFNEIVQGISRLFVWSWVEYQGPFSDQVYRSEFHAEIRVWDSGFEFEYCRSFNGVDADSYRPPRQIVPLL
jgi:hypothetical protein